jgi:plasmid stabilization system protein ParE
VRRLEFTPKARRDIEEIWAYSLERFGFEKAEAYLRELQRAAETIAEDPRRGLACDNIRSGTTDYPTPARRPANSRPDNEKLKRVYGLELPDWRKSLTACCGRLIPDPRPSPLLAGR